MVVRFSSRTGGQSETRSFLATVKKQRDVNFQEEGREIDWGNEIGYECKKLGDCYCEFTGIYDKCQQDIANPSDWVIEYETTLSDRQCFGQFPW